MSDLQSQLLAVKLRDMPWRHVGADNLIDPYQVMVSEIMLQQTQVSRVLSKFETFLQKFPSVEALAAAQLAEVLKAWNGLGYNRRAKYLHRAAQAIVNDYNGQFPRTVEELVRLPGVGKNTAGAILVYAFNQPALFIETNIRTVYIHHFFNDQSQISDAAILEKLSSTLDVSNPREFYWRLMDYGSQLKKKQGNLSRQSKSYKKQSAFAGSKRQVRGQVLRLLADKTLTTRQLQDAIGDERLVAVLDGLQLEGLIRKKKQHYQLG